jgi:hypothetical protein
LVFFLLQLGTFTQSGTFSLAFLMCSLIRLVVFIFLFFGFFQTKTPILGLLFQAPDFRYIGSYNNCAIDADNGTK